MRSRLALAGCSVALLMACAAATAEDEGIVVVAVSPGTAGAAAGVQVGDRFDSWSQGAASGTLRSPFDLAEAALEQGPRGPVHLVGTRGAEPLAVDLFPDDWGIETRPMGLDVSSPDVEGWRAQEAARADFAKGDVDGATAAIEGGVRAARAAHRPAVEAQLLAFLAGRLRDADRLDAAQKALARALEVRRAIDPSSLATASLGEPIGIVAYAQGGPEDERDAIVADAQARIEKVAPESLANARALVALAWLQGHPKGRESFARALAIAERLAPESLAAVGILRAAAWVEGDRPKRFALFERAARLQERFAPETKDMVSILSALGQEHFYRGEMAAALESHRRALELVGRIAPGSAREAHALNSMAIHWVLTGDLVQADT
jgi:tetratricopeptide (TPR) repeat protein